MIEYLENGDKAIVNGYSFRRDKKTGYYLSSAPINGRRKRLHVYVWERKNGDVPKGYHVHHKDENKNNNEIENLVLLTAGEHIHKHLTELISPERKAQISYNMINCAMPKAVEWHKSEKGRYWHKQHYEKIKDTLHQKQEFECIQCHKMFIAENTGKNKFCSNNCKSAYRRSLGVDNIERQCNKCGAMYYTNKYSPAKYCPSCSRTRNRVSRCLQYGS